MAKIKLIRNRGLAGTWTSNSENPTLPAVNLGNANRRRVWRSNATVTGEWAKVNLGAAYQVGGVAIVDGNLTTAAEVGFQANSTDSFAPPAMESLFTPWSAPYTGVVVKFFGDTQNYQWWRVGLSDSGNGDGYLEAGVIVLGEVLEFDSPPQLWDYTPVDPSAVGYSEGGTPYTLERTPYTRITIPFQALSEDQVFGTTLQDMFRDVIARQDFVLSAFPDGPQDTAIAKALNLYGRIERIERLGEVTPQRYAWTMAFRESR